MNTRTHIDTPSLPLLRRASTLIAMGTVGLALIAAGPASADTPKPKPKPATTIKDRVVVKESGVGVPNLLVTIYD
jgi:hypothetical protein